MTECEQDIQKVLSTVDKTMEEDFTMKINKQQTKIMVAAEIELSGQGYNEIKRGDHSRSGRFNYQDSKITCDKRFNREIMNQIRQAKSSFNKKKNLLTSKTISLKMRKNILQTNV